MYEVWEKVYTDTSGPFRVKSIKGNYSYSIFVDEKSGPYLAILYVRKSEFPLVFWQFVAKIARFPKILVCDSAGEMLSDTMTGTFALHELSLHVVPIGEHFANEPVERTIALIDNMVKTLLAAQNLPCNTWDILVEHSALIHAVTCLCPTNKKVTVYEAETGMIPYLDYISPVGCFAIRFLDKLDRKDFKLSPATQARDFMGYATLRHVFGAVIQVGCNAYVTARHNVSYVLDYFPHSNKSYSSHAEFSWLHTLLAKSRNKEGSVSSDKSASEIEDVSLYCAESFVKGVGTPEFF